MIIFDEKRRLENNQLLLKPSTPDDLEDLFPLAENSIWTHSSTDIRTKEDMRRYLLNAVEERKNKVRQQFTIIDKINGRSLGCSSYENISETHKRLEIGWTWLGKAFQGKGYNKVAKFLMLSFAFDTLGFERIEFRARGTNIQSQKALKNIGAIREGVLRSYFVGEGKRHDFVYFSILKPEWAALKIGLFGEIAGYDG